MIILFGVGEGNLWERPRELAGEARSRSCPRRFPPTSVGCHVGCRWCGFQSFKNAEHLPCADMEMTSETKQVWHVFQGAFNLVKENPPCWQSTKPPPQPPHPHARRLATKRSILPSSTDGREAFPNSIRVKRGVAVTPHPRGSQGPWTTPLRMWRFVSCGQDSSFNWIRKRSPLEGYFASHLGSKAQSFLCCSKVCVGWRKYLFY